MSAMRSAIGAVAKSLGSYTLRIIGVTGFRPQTGSPVDFIDLKTPYRELRDTINARIQKVLDHGQFILCPGVAELEERLARCVGAGHCVTCGSGTDALQIALMAIGVKPGDEVITCPFTFAATAEMIVLLGAKPVFVDVELDTCNIDASRIADAITPRTRAIMPVALYGQPADMDEINAIAAKHGIPVIEGLELDLRTLAVRPDRTSVFAQYTVVCEDRDGIAGALGKKGIPTAVHYPVALHQQPAYAALSEGQRYPVSERLGREVLSLPMHPYLDDATQIRIAETVRASVGTPRR